LDNSRPKDYPLADHDAYARTVPPTAYWKQVRRTVNGEPVSDEQIALIVNAVTEKLVLGPADVVLDLACGNGALSSQLFNRCAGLVGVDASPYLIEIAERDFARPPAYRFRLEDLATYVICESNPSLFTKALMYGAFQYISRADAEFVLKTLNQRFAAVAKLFIGNIPNRRLADLFYRDRTPTQDELNDNEARIGIWYLPEELEAMAVAAGWEAACSYMPVPFYGSTYRFDVTLERARF